MSVRMIKKLQETILTLNSVSKCHGLIDGSQLNIGNMTVKIPKYKIILLFVQKKVIFATENVSKC